MSIDGYQIKLKSQGNKEDAQEAFKELWEYYYPRLLIYISSFKKISTSEYDDIISEILIRAFKNIKKYNGIYSLSTWVYTIAKNYCIDVIRKLKYTTSIPIETLDKQKLIKYDIQKSIADDIIEKENLHNCIQAINTLTEKDKRIVFLKYIEGLNSKEIGLLEGISPNTIRWRLAVIKSYIAKKIGGNYEN
jgi:RNA polymerase sigma-70 factor (ECF subfamily)